MTVIVAGNPGDGFQIFGPFHSHEDGIHWAERNLKGVDWWFMIVEEPV